MQPTNNIKAHHRLRNMLRGDVNGLLVVLAVLIALMLLPGPTEAEFQARDIEMNNIVKSYELKP